MALPALVVAVAALLWLLGLAIGQGTVVQAAREGARAAARGDSAVEVRARVQEVAPGAAVSVRRQGELVRVSASLPADRPFRVLPRPGWMLTATATALVEVP